MPSDIFEQRTRDLFQELHRNGQFKQTRHLRGPLGATAQIEGLGEVVVMCSNNYLGLADHAEVVEAGMEGLRLYGAGTASVRFICGTLACHRDLEQSIASLVGTEASLTYVSCWNANEAAIATLAGPDDAIISDALNHASIIDGCRLARVASRTIYRHGDLDDLEQKLKDAARCAVRWVITDGVFSMEGTVARLPEIVALCRKYDAMLILDDSHGIGVLGKTGRGTPEHFGMLGEIDVITGTLGKALGGAAGGYAAANRSTIDLLYQRSRPSLFSNALPATVTFSARKSIEIMQREPDRVARLHSNVRAIRDGLLAAGFRCPDSPSAIIPIMIGDTVKANQLADQLLNAGVWVVPFGYPVVPEGAARLRVQVSAALTDAHIQQALAAFKGLSQ